MYFNWYPSVCGRIESMGISSSGIISVSCSSLLSGSGSSIAGSKVGSGLFSGSVITVVPPSFPP